MYVNTHIYSPAHPYTPTATLSSVTEIQICTSAELFSHTCTYTFIYPPTHPTHPQLHVHQWPRCRLCTSTELLNVQWWRMYPVHGNSSVKLHPTLCVHCLYKPIAVHATMKHLKGGQGNLITLLGHTIRGFRNCHWSTRSRKQHNNHRKLLIPLDNPHCPVPWHYCHFPTETEPLLHGLSLLLSKVECCLTAHEVRETEWNLMGLTYPRVVYHINWWTCTYNTKQELC